MAWLALGNTQKLEVHYSPFYTGNFARRSCGQPLYPLSPTLFLSSAALHHRTPFLGDPPV